MIENENESKGTLSWIFEEPVAYTIPSFRLLDNTISKISRIIYILVRILLRMTIGKDRRNRMNIFNRISANIDTSFSFLFLIFIYRIVRLLGLGNPSLIKIYVPKYKYKVYCPATELDYILMTKREDDILEHFHPNKNDVVIDVGAHLGRYTFVSSNRVGKDGKVIAIEANPIVFETLKKNVELNQSMNVMCLNYTVYSEKTKMKLFLLDESNDTTYQSCNTIIEDRYKLSYTTPKAEKCIEVNTNTLDNILPSIGIRTEDVKWIKIDVEGAEYQVLKGSQNILSKSKDIALLVEIHNISEDRNNCHSIMNFLKNYGFITEFEKIYENGERHVVFRKQ
jgi:FkbM family methyltransferase